MLRRAGPNHRPVLIKSGNNQTRCESIESIARWYRSIPWIQSVNAQGVRLEDGSGKTLASGARSKGRYGAGTAVTCGDENAATEADLGRVVDTLSARDGWSDFVNRYWGELHR